MVDSIKEKYGKLILILMCMVPAGYFLFSLLEYFKKTDTVIFVFNAAVSVYIALWMLFAAFILFKINRENFLKYSEFILFAFTFLFLLFWTPFGLDLTDEGKQMSISWFMFHGGLKHSYTIEKIGSWFVNGLWLGVLPVPFLMWERIGGVILMSVMTLFAYKILKFYRDDIYTFFITVTTMVFVVCVNSPEAKIDHSNLPTLLAILSLFFMLKYINKDFSFSGKPIYLFISSIILTVSVVTRLPHILFLMLPLFFFTDFRNKYSINTGAAARAVVYFYIPVIISIILALFVLSYKKINIISHPLSVFYIPPDKFKELLNVHVWTNNTELREISYGLFLLKRYARDFIYIIILCAIFIIGLLSGNFLYNRTHLKMNIKKNEPVIFTITGILLFLFLLAKPWMWYMAVFGFIMAYYILMKFKKISLNEEFFYLFWGFFLVIISFLGSNNSIRHSVPAGAVFILFPITALINRKNRDELIGRYKMAFLYKFTFLFFIVILLVGVYKKAFDNNKRDEIIYRLTTMYSTPALFGIFGSKDKVTEVDGIINAARLNISKDQTLLCFNSVPMLHFLLDRNYFLNDPWIIPSYRYSLGANLENGAKSGLYPDFIILSKRSAQEKNWPDTDIIIDKINLKAYNDLLDYINKYNNRIFYDTSVFSMYKHQ